MTAGWCFGLGLREMRALPHRAQHARRCFGGRQRRPGAAAWRWAVHQLFDENTTDGMFEQIFESMMEEHDGCDVEEYELMVEQFNLFAGRVAPTMIELLISVRHWVPLNQALVLDDDNLF